MRIKSNNINSSLIELHDINSTILVDSNFSLHLKIRSKIKYFNEKNRLNHNNNISIIIVILLLKILIH